VTEILAFSLRSASRPILERSPQGSRRGAGDAFSVAHYPDRLSQIVKEVGNQDGDSCLETYLQLNPHGSSKFFLFQASSSRNKRLPMNVGPFHRAFAGKDYSVGMQGMPSTRMEPDQDRDLHQRFQPVGESHQEEATCRLLSALAKRGIQEWDDRAYGWLRGHLRSASRNQSFNAVFSDGDRLFGYHAGDGSPLGFRRIANGHTTVSGDLMKVGWKQDARPGGYVLAASETVHGSQWQEFEAGELIVFRGGEIVFFDGDYSARAP
jgi:hypothetical protein